MHIRKAVTDDLDGICRLTHQINQLHHANEPELFSEPGDAMEDSAFWESKVFCDDNIAIVAESGREIHGLIIAMLSTQPSLPFLKHKKVCRIGTIVVSESQQKKGLGKQLMAEVEHWAKRQDASEIKLEVMEFNQGALRFYDTLGFRTQSRILSKTI